MNNKLTSNMHFRIHLRIIIDWLQIHDRFIHSKAGIIGIKKPTELKNKIKTTK